MTINTASEEVAAASSSVRSVARRCSGHLCRRLGSFGLWLIVPLAVVIGWEIAYAVVGAPALATPLASIQSLIDDFSMVQPDLYATLSALGISVAITIVFGGVIGFLIGLSGYWCKVLIPMLTVAYALPKVVLYPIFLLMFGLTASGRIAMSVVSGIVPLIIMCAEAARSVPSIYLRVADSYRLNRFDRVRYVVVPSVLPSVATAVRTSVCLCFLGLITAEIFASYVGLGFVLLTASNQLQAARELGIVILIVAIAFVMTSTLSYFERLLDRRWGGGEVSGSARF